MIFGWLQDGRTDRWVLVDPLFPWPALHHGRNALRAWAEQQNRRRALQHTPGPRRMPWPCQTAVKEDGSAELRIWPCEPYGHPRLWTERDGVWRSSLEELGGTVCAAIGCEVQLVWNGSDGPIERAVTGPELAGRGFIGWGKGEKAPKDREPELRSDLSVKFAANDVNVLPQGEDQWH